MGLISIIVLNYSQVLVFVVMLTENVGRLKKLEYLNLALNNIERVENLEGDSACCTCAVCSRLLSVSFFIVSNSTCINTTTVMKRN